MNLMSGVISISTLISYHFSVLKKIYVPDEESIEDRKQMFHCNSYRAIKRKLWSGRKEDPEVRIELPVNGLRNE